MALSTPVKVTMRPCNEAFTKRFPCKFYVSTVAKGTQFLENFCAFAHLTFRHFADPPKFVPPPSSTVVGIEGEQLQVALNANANPMSIAYTWTKDGLPILSGGSGVERIVSEGPILNITKLTRNDAGIYTCEAVNSQGSAMINITVIVECKSSAFRSAIGCFQMGWVRCVLAFYFHFDKINQQFR